MSLCGCAFSFLIKGMLKCCITCSWTGRRTPPKPNPTEAEVPHKPAAGRAGTSPLILILTLKRLEWRTNLQLDGQVHALQHILYGLRQSHQQLLGWVACDHAARASVVTTLLISYDHTSAAVRTSLKPPPAPWVGHL